MFTTLAILWGPHFVGSPTFFNDPSVMAADDLRLLPQRPFGYDQQNMVIYRVP